jgi:hypothetical protein
MMGLGEAWENYLPTNLSKVLDSIGLIFFLIDDNILAYQYIRT